MIMKLMSRRAVLIAGTLMAAAACGAADDSSSSGNASVDNAAVEEMVLGADDAPVTIIEYASLTCPHCRTFHVNVWPELKKKYVDTGQVRFIMREFPFDPRSSAGFMLARCMGDDKWYPTIDLLYRTALHQILGGLKLIFPAAIQ